MVSSDTLDGGGTRARPALDDGCICRLLANDCDEELAREELAACTIHACLGRHVRQMKQVTQIA